MASGLPHEPYIGAVTDALTGSGVPMEHWAYARREGFGPTRLEGLLAFDQPHADPSAWPYGVVVSWDQFAGWRYGGATPVMGEHPDSRPLISPVTPPPQAVAEAIRLLLLGETEQLPRRWNRAAGG